MRTVELGCTACRKDVRLKPELVRDDPHDDNNYALLITSHYREIHPILMDQFMHDYTRYRFSKVGLRLP